MIYTIGLTNGYDDLLSRFPEAKKIGRSKDYLGGSVWETYEEAQAFVDSLPNEHCPNWNAADFSVYGVDADWDLDAYDGDPGAPWMNLLRDAPLVKLDG